MVNDIDVLTAIQENGVISDDFGCTDVCDIQEGTAYNTNYGIQKDGKYVSVSIYADDKAVFDRLDKAVHENITDKSVLEGCIE